MEINIYKILSEVQKNLSVPKNQFNKFGGYHYRSCEDILEGLKKTLPDDAFVTISDDVKLIGDRFYIEATATLHYNNQTVSVKAMAREPLTKKGMDDGQISGATSSYARKYALNGLFCIDDNKDADDESRHDKYEPAQKNYQTKTISQTTKSVDPLVTKLENAKSVDPLVTKLENAKLDNNYNQALELYRTCTDLNRDLIWSQLSPKFKEWFRKNMSQGV